MSFNASIRQSTLADSYIQTLLGGQRSEARQIIEDAMNCGVTPFEILTKLVWPVMEQIQQLYKNDSINRLTLNMATRLNRAMADQVSSKLEQKPKNNKKVLLLCGDDEPEELGGQVAADLFEADGYDVRFAGGGVPNDEVLSMIGDYRPDLLVLFATRAPGVPHVRKLIDYLREVNSCPDMQILCCGGIYKRAEGLAEEIGADLYAPDAAEAVTCAREQSGKRATPDQQTVGRSRRIKRAPRTKSTITAKAA
jgi:methanogenic corrinoid protein MtbC1